MISRSDLLLGSKLQSHSEINSPHPRIAGIAKEVHEFAQRNSRFAVVIPVWNQGNLILSQLKRMQDADLGIDIILCDGDSSDESTMKARLESLGVRTLLVTDQAGLGTALRLGFGYVLDEGYEGAIAIDGNGKDGVESIASFQTYLTNGFDLVQGSRFISGGSHANTPWERYIGIKLLLAPLMSSASGFHYTDPTNGFKGLSRRFLLDERVQLLRSDFKQFNLQFYINYIAPELGFKTIEIAVSRIYPKDGPTPTKIVGFRIKLHLVRQFFETIWGRYNIP